MSGEVVCSVAVHYPEQPGFLRQGGIHEQPPEAWWIALCRAVQTLCRELKSSGDSVDSIAALSLDGTSGTLVCLDGQNRPIRPALMYNDGRSKYEADALNEAGAAHCARLGYRFGSSFGLAKALWTRQREPKTFEACRLFAHPADYLAGLLTGEFGITDTNNALKTGYDVLEERWPDWLSRWDGIRERLPRVVTPGSPIGRVTKAAAGQTGLPEGLPVMAGTTDGTAAFLASGARSLGDVNTTLGTTLVFKAVSKTLCKSDDGTIYSHKLPGEFWLPGGASNTGAAWIPAWFADGDPAALDREAESVLPTRQLAYPLTGEGERFPFSNAGARAFFAPDCAGVEQERYAACLQGTAFVERMSYDKIRELTGQAIAGAHCTGGGCRSDIWMQCRSDVSGIEMRRPAYPEAVLGAAVLAAAGATGEPIPSVMASMVRIENTFEPDEARHVRYTELYALFLEELAARRYISPPQPS